MNLRWDPCIVQDEDDFDVFLGDCLGQAGRRCLLIGGAGFDPRALIVPTKFSQQSNAQVVGIFFREHRPSPQPKLRPRADKTESDIRSLLPSSQFPEIEIICDGVTTVGGRNAVSCINGFSPWQFTDIFVDISALSCGVFFSIIAYLLGICFEHRHINLHVLVCEQPQFDHKIQGIPADSAAMLHGFKGSQSLDNSEGKALLWLPTLAPGHADRLSKIFQFVHRKETPIDVCPLVPFPGVDPRLPDLLVEEYREHLASWNADHHNFLYAAESDPMDSYRAIASIHATREKIFHAFGGSQIILSPVGNKMLSVGVMLAAIEKDLAVAMVESIGYDEDLETHEQYGRTELKHVWLSGEAYPA